jgi:hypothetical protein
MDALVDDVARITAAASERSEIGWRAREYVHDHYSMDAFVDEYEAFLERVASR